MNNSFQAEQTTLVELNDQALAEVAGATAHGEHNRHFNHHGHFGPFGFFGGCCGLRQVDPCCYGGGFGFYRHEWWENDGCGVCY